MSNWAWLLLAALAGGLGGAWLTDRRSSPSPSSLDFDSWLRLGIASGFCGPAVCETHDGTPTTEAEDEDLFSGWDICIHIVRLYTDDTMQALVEANHSPSVWRKPR